MYSACRFIQLFFLFPLFLSLCTSCDSSKTTKKKETSIRISTEADPTTLDPRKVRDLGTATVMHMLYEGLMRVGPDGKPDLALADSMEISPDQKTYTFHLKPSSWSNGDPVTADDFVETWKSLLNPKFPAPNAYQFYPIRGAKAAKEGFPLPDNVGIRAKDPATLVIELEEPTPYFRNLLATHFYYPVHSSMRKADTDTHPSDSSKAITNGPFTLEKWSHHNELTAIPNPHYWDKENVHLNHIALITLDNGAAIPLFAAGELDWTGSPLSTITTDALPSMKKNNTLQVTPAAGVYFFRVNTERAPFINPKLRKAFALALNRTDLIEHVLQGNQKPAFGIIPPAFLPEKPLFQDHDIEQAKKLFQEVLSEEKLKVKDMPPIVIYYASGERAHKIAQVAQQQWKNVFGIDALLQSTEPKLYFEKVKNQDYQLSIGSWFADIQDPISFLEVFKQKDNGTNNTGWENKRYIALLNQSAKVNENIRKVLLQKSEQILIGEMPVIPLFYSSFNYLKNPSLQGVYFSDLGYLDFKNAYIDEPLLQPKKN